MRAVDLDPADWDDFRELSHKALDSMIDHLQTIRSQPVWRQAPESVRQRFHTSLPRQPREFREVLVDFETYVRPYVTGNTHPLFMGWVHGAGTPVGMIGELLASGLNANCGGRNHVAIDVERQITGWVGETLGFPAGSTGLFLTGSSMANFVGLLVAKTKKFGPDGRRRGVRLDRQRPIAYASKEAHQCISQAMELAGLGSDNLRLIDTDASRALKPDALATAIERDIAAGYTPFLAVGTAGTVNTGAIDPLEAIADICKARGLWFHVDGAIGAAATLSAELRPLMKGIERADSVALDFHKWTHVPYDAGFVIIADPLVHLQTFSSEAAYLSRAGKGLAAGEVWPCDLGPDLSRSFRALKTWFAFETFGADRIGACMAHNCATARYLAARLGADGLFEVRAPVALNIVCFGVKAAGLDELNRKIVEDLHTSGEAAPSLTFLDGRPVLRAAIVNHRTTKHDIDVFVSALNERVATLQT